jgi:hypothetical protein
MVLCSQAALSYAAILVHDVFQVIRIISGMFAYSWQHEEDGDAPDVVFFLTIRSDARDFNDEDEQF